jgi:hypothetical protein
MLHSSQQRHYLQRENKCSPLSFKLISVLDLFPSLIFDSAGCSNIKIENRDANSSQTSTQGMGTFVMGKVSPGAISANLSIPHQPHSSGIAYNGGNFSRD